MDNLTVCDKFQPTILEGQLCYTIDSALLKKNSAKSGKSNGLLLLLDPKPYQLDHTNEGAERNFKVFIHTLAHHTTFRPGSYAMNMLKKMTGTESFKQLPDNQKKCLVHNREECQTQKYLEQVQKECICLPWDLQTNQVEI